MERDRVTVSSERRPPSGFPCTLPYSGTGFPFFSPGRLGDLLAIAARRASRAEGQNPLESNAVAVSGIEARKTLWLNPSKGATLAPKNGRARKMQEH